jgi:hypothetical protein
MATKEPEAHEAKPSRLFVILAITRDFGKERWVARGPLVALERRWKR